MIQFWVWNVSVLLFQFVSGDFNLNQSLLDELCMFIKGFGVAFVCVRHAVCASHAFYRHSWSRLELNRFVCGFEDIIQRVKHLDWFTQPVLSKGLRAIFLCTHRELRLCNLCSLASIRSQLGFKYFLPNVIFVWATCCIIRLASGSIINFRLELI